MVGKVLGRMVGETLLRKSLQKERGRCSQREVVSGERGLGRGHARALVWLWPWVRNIMAGGQEA